MAAILDSSPSCRCGHSVDRHTRLYDLVQACQHPQCLCREYACRECGEVAGLHCSTCSHEPRHNYPRPSVSPTMDLPPPTLRRRWWSRS